MKRSTTAEEKALFAAALSGRLPSKKTKAAQKAANPKPVKTTVQQKFFAKFVEGRRVVTDDEAELFADTLAGRRHVKPAASPIALPVLPAKRHTAKSPTGLDGHTRKKLEKGEIAPGAKLDLHGMTEQAAHGALMAFVIGAQERGVRLALVVTGKGSPGVLRRMVPRWLIEPPLVSRIAETRLAHIRHGGEGALYVYLRKAR